MAKKYVIGILVLVLLTASIYVLYPNNVRIDIGKTYSTFKVYENDSWVLSGQEYSLMFDGTKKMRASSRNVEHFVDGEIIKIIRTANFKNNVTVIDTYTFDGNEKDVKLFPISHDINVLNGEGYILVYEVTKLEYFGETIKDISSPQEFGYNMKITWEEGNYYSRIWGYADRDEGKLTIKYRPTSDNFTKQVRLFDPPTFNYIVDGNSVYINDSKVFMNITPHTSNHPTIEIISKVYSGNVDLVVGFDTSKARPTGAKYNPRIENVTKSFICPDEEEYFFNYTLNPKIGYCWYNLTSYNEENNISGSNISLIFSHEFNSGNLIERKIYWEEEEEVWTDVSQFFNSVNYDFMDYDKWFYVQGFNVNANESYKLQLDISSQNWDEEYKYFFGIKPSGETLQEAIANGHFYYVDPWTEGMKVDLVSYWSMDSYDAGVIDEMGNTTGTNIGCTLADGVVGNGIYFDGSCHVYLGPDSPTSFAGDKSIGFWIFLNTSSGARSILEDWAHGYMLIVYDSPGDVFWFKHANDNSADTYAFSENTWYHFVVTVDISTNVVKFYLNGDSIMNGTTTGNGGTTDEELSIGTNKLNGTNYFKGILDEMFISSRVMTQTEISDIYNGGSGIPFSGDADTCTYTSGNWTIDCGDYCNITSDVDLGGDWLIFSGTGIFKLFANITQVDKLMYPVGCKIMIDKNKGGLQII